MSGLLASLLAPAVLFLTLVAIMLASGRVLEAFGRASPMPGGGLRTRLEGLAGRAGVALAGILVRAGPGLNARVLGLTPATRRVMLTRGLLDQFDAPELEAVFAHEISHIRLGHFRWLLLIIAVFILLARPLESAARPLPPWIGMPLALAAFLAGWLLIFGAVSRRFELEADLAAADLVGAGPCEAALARGEEMGAGRGSIRHPTIGERRRNLAACAGDGAARRAFNRSGRRLRGGLLALLLGAAAAFAGTLASNSS
jgi:Zn-dependent protease with chaperone function